MSESPLGFTGDWFSLGLIGPEYHTQLLVEFATGEDPNPEHYRWKAFTRFLSAQTHLDPTLARRLYALGLGDADTAMGEAMCVAILRRSDCPADLSAEALASSRKGIAKAALQKTP